MNMHDNPNDEPRVHLRPFFTHKIGSTFRAFRSITDPSTSRSASQGDRTYYLTVLNVSDADVSFYIIRKLSTGRTVPLGTVIQRFQPPSGSKRRPAYRVEELVRYAIAQGEDNENGIEDDKGYWALWFYGLKQ